LLFLTSRLAHIGLARVYRLVLALSELPQANAMLTKGDHAILEEFAKCVRDLFPAARIWAFGSRARGDAAPDSDLDVCIVVSGLTRNMRDRIREMAWEIGFEHGLVLSTVLFSTESFEHGPMAASTLVANIHREGVAA